MPCGGYLLPEPPLVARLLVENRLCAVKLRAVHDAARGACLNPLGWGHGAVLLHEVPEPRFWSLPEPLLGDYLPGVTCHSRNRRAAVSTAGVSMPNASISFGVVDFSIACTSTDAMSVTCWNCSSVYSVRAMLGSSQFGRRKPMLGIRAAVRPLGRHDAIAVAASLLVARRAPTAVARRADHEVLVARADADTVLVDASALAQMPRVRADDVLRLLAQRAHSRARAVRLGEHERPSLLDAVCGVVQCCPASVMLGLRDGRLALAQPRYVVGARCIPAFVPSVVHPVPFGIRVGGRLTLRRGL